MTSQLTDEQLRQLRDDPLADYHHAGITAMAAELLALRARVAELEAAQREPLGYVPMSIRDDGRMLVSGGPPRSREEAQEDVDWYKRGGFDARLVELREVGE